jgi:phosphonoacetate hydrolase
MQLEKGKKTIILMLDGFGTDYFYASDMPVLKKMAQDGFYREGKAVFPTLTNANNISIVCGSFPQTHGVTTNCYLDPITGRPEFLENPGFLKSPTLFEMAARQKIRSALVTSKSKTIRILGGSVDAGLSAQDADSETIRYFGSPPDIYSIEVNEWIVRSGMKILQNRPDIDILYIHTTDYPMHMWAPEDERSLSHLSRLDRLIGELVDRYPDAAFLVTADHGMNPKKECLDLEKILRASGFPIRAAISPVADRLVKHHGGHGGVSYLYLEDQSCLNEILDFLSTLSGVDMALPAEKAALRYRLDGERIGDIVVGADLETVFGTVEHERVNLHQGYRNHGSRFEESIPLIAWNTGLGETDGIQFNLDLTKAMFFE